MHSQAVLLDRSTNVGMKGKGCASDIRLRLQAVDSVFRWPIHTIAARMLHLNHALLFEDLE